MTIRILLTVDVRQHSAHEVGTVQPEVEEAAHHARALEILVWDKLSEGYETGGERQGEDGWGRGRGGIPFQLLCEEKKRDRSSWEGTRDDHVMRSWGAQGDTQCSPHSTHPPLLPLLLLPLLLSLLLFLLLLLLLLLRSLAVMVVVAGEPDRAAL